MSIKRSIFNNLLIWRLVLSCIKTCYLPLASGPKVQPGLQMTKISGHAVGNTGNIGSINCLSVGFETTL